MSSAVLTRPRERQSLLSDQTYRGYGLEPRTPRHYSAPPITMEASQSLIIPFGSGAFFEFDEEPPKWFMPLLSQICQLGDLPPDWNSYGAKPVDPETAAHAVTLLLEILSERDPRPTVVPTSRGGLLIEWHEGGIDLEVDVRSPSSIHVAFEDGGREEEFENAELELVQDKLNVLRGRL